MGYHIRHEVSGVNPTVRGTTSLQTGSLKLLRRPHRAGRYWHGGDAMTVGRDTGLSCRY